MQALLQLSNFVRIKKTFRRQRIHDPHLPITMCDMLLLMSSGYLHLLLLEVVR